MKKSLKLCIYFYWIISWMHPEACNLHNPEQFQFQDLDYYKENEPQLFLFWGSLTREQKLVLKNQLQEIDIDTLREQKKIIEISHNSMNNTFDSFEEFTSSGNRECFLMGQEMIKRGEVGCLVLAGGQGTRLNHTGPKGTYPISIIKQKSLFQLIAEKVCAASSWANVSLRLAIMTSSENDHATRLFFQENDYFGLHSSQVSFFIQQDLPFLDEQGKLFLKAPSEISMGPNGNGNSIICLKESGILNDWVAEGIKLINVILIDNPLADPFDAELAGFHHQQGDEVTLKCTEKIQPNEKVGVLVRDSSKCRVIEYSEMPEQEKNLLREDGHLKHCCANLSLLCFSTEFIQRMYREGKTIPLHKALKGATFIDDIGPLQNSKQAMAWKFETYIFDWLHHTEKVSALLCPREQCFAPLKNTTGLDSPNSVREAIQAREKQILISLNLEPPDFPFELAAEFYYPTPDFLLECRRWSINSNYLDPIREPKKQCFEEDDS